MSPKLKKNAGGVVFPQYLSRSQLMRVCKCVQNEIYDGEEGQLRPGPGRRSGTESTGRLAGVPSSFNELEHLFPDFSLPPDLVPSFSSGQVQPAQGSGALQSEVLILTSP